MVDTSDEWIQSRTGIKERRWIDPESGETTSSMAAKASEIAIERAGLTKNDIDFIILLVGLIDKFKKAAGQYEGDNVGSFK